MLLRVREDVPIRTEVKDPDTNKRIEAFDKDENPIIKYAIICKYTITRRASSRENLSSGFLTRSDTNRAVQTQMIARGLKFRI